jgi:SAM-dependent methyltransferase
MTTAYVHGYDPRENLRLQDQAGTLVELLHSDTTYPPGSRVLEAGCGVGAQTLTLAKNSPGAFITAFDISEASVAEAGKNVAAAGLGNVRVERADIFHLPYGPGAFDHVFVCFLLEHLAEPVKALRLLGRHLRRGGTITVIEGDHGSTFFHPDSEAAHRAIRCQVELQRKAGGKAMIGRELYPLLTGAGYGGIRVSPRMVYVDASKPVRGGFHEENLYGHDRGGPGILPEGGHDRTGRFRRRDPGPLPDGGARRGVLLHLLQGRGRKAMILVCRRSRTPVPAP